MVDALSQLFEDLDLGKLRMVRPSKFVFLCGGKTNEETPSEAFSLRDYLYRVCALETQLNGSIVLAEKANQLYRDTHYRDLISFEEDIARIASIVLVIAESQGSLAELGAFASNDTIRRALRIIIQQKYEKEESFIRYGPTQRTENEGAGFVAFFPWDVTDQNIFIEASAHAHREEMIKYIQKQLNCANRSSIYTNENDVSIFYVVLWIIFLSLAISWVNLYECVKSILGKVESTAIRNKLYCMQMAGWVKSERYSGKEYFYSSYDVDPFDYAFKDNVAERDTPRRKALVTKALVKLEDAPKHVRIKASKRREAP